MPGRKQGTPNQRTLEFIQHYDQLLKKYQDPVEVCFKLLNARKQSFRLQAASILMTYRFPKMVAQKIEVEEVGQLELSWLGAEPKPETLDIPDLQIIDAALVNADA